MAEEINIENTEKKHYKTKEYVRRANNKYKKNKYNNDEDFRNKTLEMSKLNYEKHKERYKEKLKENYNKNKDNEEYKTKRKLYMQAYRARKKAEKQLAEQQISGKDEKSDSKEL